MRYDPSCKEPMIQKYPSLAGITKDDKLLRVVLYMIQEDSPFLLDDKDNYEARLEKVQKHLDSDYPNIMRGENMDYNHIATSLFMMMDNLVYVMWQSKILNFAQLTAFLRKPLNVDDIEKSVRERLNVEKALPEMHKSLVEYEKQIFPDTHTRKVVRQETARLLQFAEKNADPKQVL